MKKRSAQKSDLTETEKRKVAKIVRGVVAPHIASISEELRKALKDFKLPTGFAFEEETCGDAISCETKWKHVLSFDCTGKVNCHVQPPTSMLFSIPVISIVRKRKR